MELVRNYLNHVVAELVVRVVATSLVVALDAMNASAAMVLVAVAAAVAFHAVDKPFSVNPNPKYHNRVADCALAHLCVDDDVNVNCDADDDGVRNWNNEMMEYHFQDHHLD